MSIKNIKDATNIAVDKISVEEAVIKFKALGELAKIAVTNESFGVLAKMGFNPEESIRIIEESFSSKPELPHYIQFNAPKGIALPSNGVIVAAWSQIEAKINLAVDTINQIIKRNEIKDVGFFGITAGVNLEHYGSSLYSVVLERIKDANPDVTFYVMDNMIGKNSVGGEQEDYRTPEEAFKTKYKFELVIIGANHTLSDDETPFKCSETLLDNAVRKGYNVYDINTSLIYKATAPAPLDKTITAASATL